MPVRRWLLALAICCVALRVWAHEGIPAYLEIKELSDARYALTVKRPMQSGRMPPMRLKLPESCYFTDTAETSGAPGSVLEYYNLTCAGGIAGKSIRFEELEATGLGVLTRMLWRDGTVQTALVEPDAAIFSVLERKAAGGIAWEFLRLGIEHILYGIDHLLFVLGILLLVQSPWTLVKTITAFTVAHSCTLLLASLDIIHVPQAPVEAVIALSILFLARELWWQRHGEVGIMSRAPWLVAFLFGLIHGLGFAGALAEIGLPPAHIPLALLLFNVGVEAGQLLFVGGVLGGMRLFRNWFDTPPRWVAQLPAYGSGSAAAFWCIERIGVIIR